MCFILFSLLLIGCKKSGVVYINVSGHTQSSKTNNVNTIPDAFIKATEIREKSNASIVIQLGPEDYYLDQPLTISPILSNLTLLGAENGLTSIKGSQEMELSWSSYDENIWVSDVPDEISFDQLFVNGEKQILARYPNYNEDGGHWQGFAEDAIAPERIETWLKPIGAIFHVMHGGEWGGFHYLITGVNKEGEAILSKGHQNNRPSKGIHDKYRMVENVFEELDSPREWYLDKEKNKLYLWTDNIDIHKAKVEAVHLKHLINISGTIENPVRNVTIDNIHFEHTKRTIMEDYEPLLRSDWTIYRGGAIYVEGSESVVIKDCELSNLGGNVVFVSNYNKDLLIEGNHIHDCDASAVSFIGSPTAVRSPSFQYGEYVDYEDLDTIAGPKNELYPRNCTVTDNLIYRIGRLEKQTAGVQISMARSITVRHNSIYEVPRAGINISEGTWGGHLLEYNDVFDTVLESGDHGAFNSWGRDRFWHPVRATMDSIVALRPEMVLWDAIDTTVIRNNRFRCDHGWDIDLDDGSTNYHIYNNICLNGGIKLREGFHRTVENNITLNNGFHPHVWFKDNGDIFRRNIVMGNHKNIFLQEWGKEVDYNLFPSEGALRKEQEKGVDKNSTFGDPLFVDSKKGDYRLEEDSPAFKIGFKNIDMDDFGVKKPELKAIAKTPPIPELWGIVNADTKEMTLDWMGATIKTITTMAERSAAGLKETAGVVLLDIEDESIISKTGLQPGDVIIQYDDGEVADILGLMDVYQKYIWKEKIDIVVVRNQEPHKLTIKTKK